MAGPSGPAPTSKTGKKLAPKAERLSWECIDEMLLHAPEEVPESQTPAGTLT